MIGTEQIRQALVFGIGFLIIVAISAVVVKAYARSLGFTRSFLIALAGCVVLAIPSAILLGVEAMLPLSVTGTTTLNSIAGVLALTTPPIVINWLAKKSGYQTTGRLGLGGKTVLTTWALCALLVFAAGAFRA